MVRLATVADSKNVMIATPIIGETTVYGSNIRSARWWEEAMGSFGGVLNTAEIDKDI
jgi:hypothetical protein